MKKLALINSYCDTWEKLTILLQNVKKLKELGVDSLVYSPIHLPKEITDQLNYVILTKENPIINWPERGIVHWSKLPSNHQITLIVPDYGWASIYQYKKMMEFGSTLDYDYYFWFLYDLNIDSVVESTLLNPHNQLFFKSTKAKSSKVGGIFASFNKENINKIHPLLNKQDYIETCKGQIAEYFLETICTKINGQISDHTNSDIMDEHGKLSFNKANLNHPFKMFFTNEGNLNFVFWDFSTFDNFITLEVNNKFYDFNLTPENNTIETQIDTNTIKKIGYFYNKQYTDLLSYFGDTSKVLQLIEKI